MVPHKVSFEERLSLSQRVPYQRIVDRKLSACDTLNNQTISLSLYTQRIPPPSPTYYYMIHILLPLQTQSQPTHNQPTSQQSYNGPLSLACLPPRTRWAPLQGCRTLSPQTQYTDIVAELVETVAEFWRPFYRSLSGIGGEGG